MKKEEIKREVRIRYAAVAEGKSSCCDSVFDCCSGGDAKPEVSRAMGYSPKEIESVPAGSDLGLGCGNPTALADLGEGESVLDLGSGGGFDCFLAAQKVGKSGRVVGVDMTVEMIDRARENAALGGMENVEFRLGEIENLPAADNSFDKVISNCVINLSTDKVRVFGEIHRVLKPGGKFIISDIVLESPLPDKVRESAEAYSACIAGALQKEEYLQIIGEAGFTDIIVEKESRFPLTSIISDDSLRLIETTLGISTAEFKGTADSILSVTVSGRKQ